MTKKGLPIEIFYLKVTMNSTYSTAQLRLQQQPQRHANRQQQQSSGASEMQGGSEKVQQMGEGSSADSRDHEGDIKSYLKKSDVKFDLHAAKPKNLQEAIDLERAERQVLSHARAPER